MQVFLSSAKFESLVWMLSIGLSLSQRGISREVVREFSVSLFLFHKTSSLSAEVSVCNLFRHVKTAMVSRSDTKMSSLSNLSNAVCSFSITSISLNVTDYGLLSLIHRQKATQIFVHLSSKHGLGSCCANSHLLISSTVWVSVSPKTIEYVEWVLLKLSYEYTHVAGHISSISFWKSRSFAETFCLVITVDNAWVTPKQRNSLGECAKSLCL